MRRPPLLLTVLALGVLTFAACTSDDPSDGAATTTEPGGDSEPEEEPRPEIEVGLTNDQGAPVGTVTLSARDDGVRVDARLENLPPGFHGFHVHDVGLCEAAAPDGPFTTAMGHFVGEGGTHGDHDGDLPSVYVKEEGTARLTVDVDTFLLEELTAGDGTAVMVHAGPDNFANLPDRYTSSESGQPGPDEMTNSTGDAGARAACGVVTAPVPEA